MSPESCGARWGENPERVERDALDYRRPDQMLLFTRKSEGIIISGLDSSEESGEARSDEDTRHGWKRVCRN